MDGLIPSDCAIHPSGDTSPCIGHLADWNNTPSDECQIEVHKARWQFLQYSATRSGAVGGFVPFNICSPPVHTAFAVYAPTSG